MTVVLQAYCRHPRTNVSTLYDRQTRKLLSLQAADQRPSRKQILSSVLRTLNQDAAKETLPQLANDPDHFVRWHAARELTALDAMKALPILKNQSRDKNPRVRKAAQATLTMVQQHLDSQTNAAA